MKQTLRKQFLQHRNNLPVKEIAEKSSKICESIINLPQFIKCDTIFTYQSFGSEVDTKLLIEHAWNTGKKVCIPKVADKNKMDFYFIKKGQPLKENTYGILEPTEEEGSAFALPDEKSIFIIPGLAFDKNGYRIGYGAGYYDFYFAKHKPKLKIGICFDFQVTDNAYPDSHDIPVSVIVTEKRIIELYDQ